MQAHHAPAAPGATSAARSSSPSPAEEDARVRNDAGGGCLEPWHDLFVMVGGVAGALVLDAPEANEEDLCTNTR
jgi:hypothetical protein